MRKNIVSVLISLIAMTAVALLLKNSFDGENSPLPEKSTGQPHSDTTVSRYVELPPVSFNQMKLRCMVLSEDGSFVCGGENIIVRFSAGGKIIASKKTDRTVLALAAMPDGGILAASDEKISMLSQDLSQESDIAKFADNPIVTSLAYDDGAVFLADAGAKKVLKFTLDGKQAGCIDGKRIGAPIGFELPSPFFDIAIDSISKSIWIADGGRHKIAKFNYDGVFQSEWGQSSVSPDGFCGCCNPIHFTISKDASFITAEKGICRLKKYALDGTFSGIIADQSSFDEGTIILDLAVDASGRALVLDPSRNQIRIFIRRKCLDTP